MSAPFMPPMPRGGEEYGAWYDWKTAEKAVKFFSDHLVHTTGEWYGRPFVLTDWQANEIIRPVFGWKREDGTRLIRVVYVELPRKNGKTELGAGIALLVLIGDGEMNGEGYSIARDREQAKIVFKKATIMAQSSPSLSRYVECFSTALFVPHFGSSFKPLSSNAASKHGLNPSFCLGDELHEWPDGEIHDVVHKGTVSRAQPLEFLITTAGEPGQGYGWEKHNEALEILSGVRIDPTTYCLIYAADPKDAWDQEATWKKANPNFGVSVKVDYLRTEVERARGSPRKEGDFKRFHLNIWNDQTEEGLDTGKWDEVAVTIVTLESLRGRKCWAGLDLSAVSDLTSFCLISPKMNGPGYDVFWKCWMPDLAKTPDEAFPTKALKKRIKDDRVPYDQWIADGWIEVTKGNVVDYDIVRDFISGSSESGSERKGGIVDIVDLQEVAYDPWNATQITTQLTGDKVIMVPFRQGFQSMSAPSKALKRSIHAGEWNHGGNPVARWAAACVRFKADEHDNIKPVKPDRRKSARRIDPIVASIMALGRAELANAQKKSVYEDRGIVVV